MLALIYRLRIEHRELAHRCEKLKAFIATEKFVALEPGAQSLLAEQKSAMDHYLFILSQRLEMLTGNPDAVAEIGEVTETGTYDIDRDGPIPFN